MSKGGAAIGGFSLGVILGYPLSYFLQPGALRAKMSIGSYIQHADDILGNKDLGPTAIGTWIACIVLFTVIGAVLGGRSSPRA